MKSPLWLLSALYGLIAAAAGPNLSTAGPIDDLLPTPARHSEKRVFGGNDRRSNFNGRSVGRAVFSPNGKFLFASMGYNGTSLFDAETGRLLGNIGGQNGGGEGACAAFTPDSQQMVVCGFGRQEGCPVGLYDVAKRERIRSLDDDVNDMPFTAIAVSPDGQTIALAASYSRRNEAPSICFWDAASGDEISRMANLMIPERPNRRGMVINNLIEGLAYSPDGRQLAVLYSKSLFIVETATRDVRRRINFNTSEEAHPEMREAAVGSVAFSPDGKTIAAAGNDGAIRRFDLRTGRELAPLPSEGCAIVALNYAADGKTIRSYNADGQFVAWKVDSVREWKPKTAALADDDLDNLWSLLRSEDPLELFGCVETMAANPEGVAKFLKKHVSPVAKADTARIDRLVTDATKGDYNTRKRAIVELRKFGSAAVPALRKTQEQGYDELSQRLLFEFENLPASAEQTRAVRAVWVLEKIADEDARKFLKELAAGSSEAPVTVQAKAALDRLSRTVAAKEMPADTLWDKLADENGADAYRAMCILANQPVGVLSERLAEMTAKDTFNDDPARVAKLIKDLDSDKFPTRTQAREALQPLARRIVPQLKKALDAKPGAEMEEKLEELLKDAAKPAPSKELLRFERALETIELKGGPEALQLLEKLAKEAKGKWLRDLAADSLQRQRGMAAQQK